jgi:PAS domain S-box-containing protein
MKSRVGPTAVILLPAVIILAVSVLVLELQRRSSAADEATRESLAVEHRLQETLSALADIETGQRGFLLVGDEAFLEPYHAGLQRWRSVEAELMSAERVMQPEMLLTLRELIVRKLAHGARLIELTRTGGSAEAERLMATGYGRELMDTIRSTVAEEQEAQRRASAKRTAVAARQKRLLATTLLLGTLVTLMAAVAGAVILMRHVRALEENAKDLHGANETLQEQASSLEEHADELERRGREMSALTETLRRSETRVRTLIENLADIIAVRGDDGTLTFASPSLESVLGWPVDEAVGSRCLDAVHPDDAASVRAAYTRAVGADGGVVQFEMRVAHRDRSWRVLQVQARRVVDETVSGIVINARDVTERRLLEDQLRQSQKMDAIGRLAGGISHDFNNLLTAIQGSVHFALQDLAEQHPARADVAAIGAAVERASALTRQLLSFSRKRPARVEPVDVAGLLRDIERMLGRLLGEDIELLSRPAAGLWPVLADPGQLDQILINLAVNARDAMPSGGTLRISARNELIDEAYSEAHIHVQPGEYVVLTVSDSGVGMDAATRAQIFEPFFTTKPAGSGTGLGLSTVYGIVKQLGGHIWVYSETGLGSTFKIHLPRAIGVVTEAASAGPAAPRRQAAARILLAEDDPAVRGLARRTLERAGYCVLEADGPELALNLVQGEEGGQVDLLLTDMIMPSMSGGELATRVRRILPDLPTIFMSGYTQDVIITRGMLSEADTFLEKPFAPEALVLCVARVLGGTGEGSRVVQQTG